MVELAKGVREGDILVQKYRVERVLGAGAMGVVVAAYHLGLDTRVAIKLLHPQMLESEEVVTRFAREARAAAKITSEHVARVIDVGALDDGAPFIVMELLDGADLHQWLERHGPLPVEQAVDFVLQASEAIAEAHRLGIVHRDLKPSNLFCVRRGDGTLTIKVLDFGISKMSSGGGAGSSVSMTRTATVIGTPLYMSPEQMESSRGVDARADVWALGVILFELLAGKSPFHADALPEVCLKIATRAPPPLRALRADVPKEMETAILACLEKDRDKRCQNVADFCDAIARFGPPRAAASAERIHRTMRGSSRPDPAEASNLGTFGPGSYRTPSLETIGAVGHTRTGLSRRKTGVLWGSGAFVAILAVVATVLLVRTSAQPAQALTAPPAALPRAMAATEPSPPTRLAPPPPLREPDFESATREAARAATADAAPAQPLAAKPHKATPASAGLSSPKAGGQLQTSPPPVPPAPPQSEPSKGSSAYDERL